MVKQSIANGLTERNFFGLESKIKKAGGLSSMRKIISLLAVLLTCVAPLTTHAEALPTSSFSQHYHWSQTYNANNREIAVDLDIAVPNALEADVLTARIANSSLTEEQLAHYEARGKAFNFGVNNSYEFLGMGVNNPFITLPGQKGGRCKTWMLDLTNADPTVAYAENNPVTLGQAWDIFLSEVAYCYGEEIAQQLVADEIKMRDRLKKNEHGEPLREYGSYQFTALQSFHGIPLLCHVVSAFNGNIRGERFRLNTGLIGIIANEESFDFRFSLMKEEDVVAEKAPICSVEDAIASFEEYIAQGRIRNVYSVKLAYTLWNDGNDKELFYLIPCWVAECDYYSSARKKDVKMDADMEHYTDKTCYHKVMVNALTGKIIDPEDKSKTRCEVRTDWFKK